MNNSSSFRWAGLCRLQRSFAGGGELGLTGLSRFPPRRQSRSQDLLVGGRDWRRL